MLGAKIAATFLSEANNSFTLAIDDENVSAAGEHTGKQSPQPMQRLCKMLG